LEDTNTFDERFFTTLITQLLAQSPDALENDRLEIKSWCRSEHELIDKVVDASLCIANAHGGHVLVGLDDKGFRRFSACPHANVSTNWLVNQIQDHTHPPVACKAVDLTSLLAEVRGAGGANLFALIVDKKRTLSGHTNDKGISRIRVGNECRIQYTADDDRTNALVPDIVTGDLSLDSIHWAISQYRRSFSPLEVSSDPWEFLAGARLLQNSDSPSATYDHYSVTQAALILFGKQAALNRALPYCQTVLKTAQGHVDIRKNVVESIRELLIGDQARLRQICPVMPQEAFKELLVNAYMHRSWRTNGPVVISVSGEWMEFENPGDLLPGLHVNNLIYCVPVYRNLLLAEGLRFAGLADKIGQGIDIIFRSMICAGLDFPSFDSDGTRFCARLPLKQNPEFQEFLRHRGPALPYLVELVVLRYLWAHPQGTLPQLSAASQRGKEIVGDVIEGMVRKSMVEAVAGADSTFQLATGVRADIESVFSRNQMHLFPS
jgi:ATP-dependent DNA helicase RecG